MGSRDKGGREQKKPRKDNKKIITTINTEPSSPVVEVIKRGKKDREEV